jgi:hypothetical protein
VVFGSLNARDPLGAAAIRYAPSSIFVFALLRSFVVL